jgi:hypothetical protein
MFDDVWRMVVGINCRYDIHGNESKNIYLLSGVKVFTGT